MKKRKNKKSKPTKSFIDKRDEAVGFNVYGLKKTGNKNIMIAVTFTTTRDSETAIKNGKVAFKYGAERVEIQGNKTPKLYYVITKEGRKFIIKENKNQRIKSKFHGNSIKA